MADAQATDEQQANPETAPTPDTDLNETPDTQPEAPAEPETRSARARKGGAPEAGPANDHVLGEGDDAKFNPLAHGKQTALENATAENE